MKFTVVIPARFASTRLPGKPLANIAGKPMVIRVVEQALKSEAARVIVATDHQAVYDAVDHAGYEVIMTREDHESGTDRLQEVASALALSNDEIVVNVQGDEPLIPESVINQVARNLHENPSMSASTLSEPLHRADDFINENVVKVVSSQHGRALYFSRAPIPWVRGQMKGIQTPPSHVARHIGIYGYRVSLLNQFVTWPVAELESIEKLEQLRILANDHTIHIASACALVPGGVDTEQDLVHIQSLFSE